MIALAGIYGRVSTDLRPSPLRRLVILGYLSPVCAVIFLFGLWPLNGGDLSTQLTVGRWMWARGWRAGLIFYLINLFAGTVGFAVLRFALRSAALVCAVRVAMLLLAPVVLGIMWGQLECRPQLFTTVPLALQRWVLVSVHTGQRSRNW